MDRHEHIYLPRLLMLGGLAETEGEGLVALSRGRVTAERWTLSIHEATLPRWVLRGVTISLVDGRSMRISEDGERILRAPQGTLV